METKIGERTRLISHPAETEIIIQSKKMGAVILFLGLWLSGWVLGELFALFFLFETSLDVFLLLWLIAWTIGGFFVINFFLWMTIGKEVITVQNESLLVLKKGILFPVSSKYPMRQIRHIHVQEMKQDPFIFPFSNRINALYKTGSIRFECNGKAYSFGIALSEYDAREILRELREQKRIE